MKKEISIVLAVIAIAVIVSAIDDSPYFSPDPVIRSCVEEIPSSDWIIPFREYLKDNENRQREERGNDGLWRPIDSPEGGYEICYGHKLQEGEPPIVLRDGTILNPPLTDDQCDRILEDDIRRHIDRVLDPEGCFQKWLRKNFPDRCLTPEEIIMFTDYSFTGVLCQFPKFSKGVIIPDWTLACNEYKRYYYTPPDKTGQKKKLPLRERNSNFCCNFLEERGCDCGVDCSDRRYDFPE